MRLTGSSSSLRVFEFTTHRSFANLRVPPLSFFYSMVGIFLGYELSARNMTERLREPAASTFSESD
ncbi:hypothetical protein BV25DRAFT_713448 [Artomyces pyxidatus]|uniref:Uncharacterized protein n=1 Tax=Artomyces pyxidatus TaxID=48021 RepID=A0ACB8T0B6_9AGAM|nr:hypothetical protein BV25DRAFT_713448 [Artomyces pyxidatus]